MFFSPGFGPLLFRNNGPIVFPAYHQVDLRQQAGEVSQADASFASGLAVGVLPVATRKGFKLMEPDERRVDGRPVVGMLGRALLPDNAVVILDIPGRLVTVSTTCPDAPRLESLGSIAMQQNFLLVPIEINGHGLEAILDPDLPASILPRRVALDVGLDAAALDRDASVVTEFGKGVLGRRHHVSTLAIGNVHLHDVAFDVEGDVAYPMLGLNVFSRGKATFDFRNNMFLFRMTSDTTPAPTALHFDRTRVAHVNVEQ